MAASTNLLLKEVKDITECPICTEMFCDPKMLPCFHTFCLKCIEQYGEDKRPGEALPCPMCRREFKVPTGGFSELSTNFFIDRLIIAHSRSISTSEVDCDVCKKVGKESKVVASSFCLTCREHLCDDCCKIHKNMKMTKGHKFSLVCEVSESIRKKLEAGFCKKHPTKELKYYCQVCKVPSCSTCSKINHNSHKLCEIGDTADEFKKDFLKYSDYVSRFMMNIRERSARSKKQIELFTLSIEQVEREVIKRSEEIKRLVDRQTADLLRELDYHKTSKLKNIRSDMEDLQMNMMICDNFKQFCTKVVKEGDSVEVVRVADELKTRAEEVKLLSLPDFKTIEKIEFVSSDILNIKANQENIVGTFTLQNEKDAHRLSSPRFSEKLPTSGLVQGITSSNDGLYIVTSHSPDIDVYDIDTLAHRRKIRVEGLVNGCDIVAHANVLYVSETEDKLIHKIQLSVETSSHWSVNSRYLRMSINKTGNVVVPCWSLNKIIEYTPTGSCVREIKVDAIDKTISGLMHAIQLDDGRFVICYATTTHHRVCIIDSNGRMMKSYGGGAGSGIGEMDCPCYLAIDRNGFFLVAEHNNCRIIQLNASLEFIRELIPGSVGLMKPLKMHLHEKRNRLYVSDFGEQSIAIYNL